MKKFLKIEEASLFLFCIFLFSKLGFDWWWFPVLLLLPDIGMIGYVISHEVGAFTYNVTHNRVVATVSAFYAIASDDDYWKLTAIIIIAHIALDRALGYGLKYTDNFQNTHLGPIGKEKGK